MQIIKKEIDDLYYLEVTSNFVVVNDAYRGINIMDFDLNIVRSIELEEDVVISFSIKREDELVLFCYENECAFHVDLKTSNVCRYDLSDYSDVYFSRFYFWKGDIVYIFADGGEITLRIDLSSTKISKLSSSELSQFSHQKYCKELLSRNILSYDNDNCTALIIKNGNYCIWNPDNQVVTDMNIPALNQKKDEIPSDQIFCKTNYSNDAVVCISEKTILITIKGNESSYIYPPYELYRFSEGKIVDSNEELFLFALCNDNSSEGSSLLMRYNKFDKHLHSL